VELDFSDPDTLTAIAGIVAGLVCGIGAPLWYISRTERDEERLEELRAMNRATFEATGEYMTDVSSERAWMGHMWCIVWCTAACAQAGQSCVCITPRGTLEALWHILIVLCIGVVWVAG
jgi:hypothetical protein